MVRHFLILENSETELSVDPRNGRRNNTTRSSLVLLAGVANPRRGCQLSELQGWVDNSGYCLRDEIFNFSGSLRPKT